MRSSAGASRMAACAAAVLAGAWCAAASAAEEKAGVEASLDVTGVSAYVWRGQVLSDDPAVQPSLTVSKGGFSVNVWANIDLGDDVAGDSGEVVETDFTLSYAFDAKPFGFEVGYIEYVYPHQMSAEESIVETDLVERYFATPGTREVYAAASLPDLPVVPSLTAYYDFDEVDGYYLSAALTYTHEMDKVSLELSGSAGYGSSDFNAYSFGVDDGALNDATFRASATFQCTDALSVTPAVEYSMMLDGDIEDAAKAVYGDAEKVVGSLTLTYAF